jgi:hypothetical protein
MNKTGANINISGEGYAVALGAAGSPGGTRAVSRKILEDNTTLRTLWAIGSVDVSSDDKIGEKLIQGYKDKRDQKNSEMESVVNSIKKIELNHDLNDIVLPDPTDKIGPHAKGQMPQEINVQKLDNDLTEKIVKKPGRKKKSTKE